MERDYMEGTYPDQVNKYVVDVVDLLLEDGFFQEEEIDPRIFYRVLADRILQNWLQNVPLKLDEKEMMEVITRAAASSVLENLKKKGVINSVEDEDGEEHFFLTEEGKKIAESIQKNYNGTQKDSE
jgi:hypothetical protein